MADWLEKVKSVSSTKGSSAPESAKRAGIGCLSILIAAVSILSFIIAFSLFGSGNWVLATFALIFALLSAMTVWITVMPDNHNSL